MRRLGHLDIQTTLNLYGWVTEDAEMRTVPNWTSYVDGWRGLHEPTHQPEPTCQPETVGSG